MKTAIFGNEFLHDSLPHLERLLMRLQAAGTGVAIEAAFLDWLRQRLPGMPQALPIEPNTAFDADMVLSIGGDGTFLRTAHLVAQDHLPIMGVNAGHLGYLTTTDVSNTDLIMRHLLSGRYRVEQRIMLELLQPLHRDLHSPFALNEIAVLRQDTSSMIEVEVRIDGALVMNFAGDGLILATPTGSTAYNLSVGGPILQPGSHCFVLSPISPHALTMRPMVISDKSDLTITTRTRAALYQVSVDGETVNVPSGTTLHIAKAPIAVSVVQLPGHDFASTLRQKMLWGSDMRGSE